MKLNQILLRKDMTILLLVKEFEEILGCLNVVEKRFECFLLLAKLRQIKLFQLSFCLLCLDNLLVICSLAFFEHRL